MESRAINIYDNELDPATVTAKPGTTVIWVNNSNNTGEIRFLGKRVTMACGAPVNFVHGVFNQGVHSGYESNEIFQGGIASLCFLEKGKYEYVYKVSKTDLKQKEKEYKGVIIIE